MDDPSGNMKELSNTIKVSLLNLTNSSRKQIYFPFNKMGNRNHQRRRQNVRYYYLRPGDFTERERRLIHLTIHDPRGWITTHSAVEHTLNKANSDIRIHKVSRREMRKRFPQMRLKGLSVTESSPHGQANIYFDQQNWNRPPPRFTGDRTTYRQYLIQHEMGHALMNLDDVSLKHFDEKKPCPVMYQQSLGTVGKCQPNPWSSGTGGEF